MKSTGVVRKIDELGRIVIPKEIRRNLRIHDGENLEIFIDENSIILKKFSKIADLKDIIMRLCDLIYDTMDQRMFITDRDHIIAVTKTLEHMEGKNNNEVLMNLLLNSESYQSKEVDTFTFDGESVSGYYYIAPIITSMDNLGLVGIICDKENKLVMEFVKFISKVLSEKIDIA